ncbi:MAG: hypothetical protein JNJ88_11765 [Planctomycetes bacterium]|nr:hypothetical protein [Planctomycetota bacterium]
MKLVSTTLPLLSVAVLSVFGGGCAASKNQEKLELVRQAAREYYDLGDLTRAADRARAALEIEPDDALTLSILGMTRTRQARSTNAGVADLKLLAQALDCFERAEDHGGGSLFSVVAGHGFARAERGHALLTHAEACEQKIAISGAAGDANKEAKDAVAKLRNDAAQAREIAERDLKIAEDRLVKAHEMVPTRVEVMERLQALCSLRGRAADSISWGERALEVLDRGRTERAKMLERAGRDPRSEDEARKAIRGFEIQEAGVRSLMALMLYREKKVKEAAAHLDRVLEIDPERIDDYYNRGICRQALGMYALATRDYETFVKRSTLSADSKEMRDVWDRIAACREKSGAPATDLTQKSGK